LLLGVGIVLQSRASEPLSGAVITGSSAYTPERLFPAYRALLGQRVDPLGARAVLANIESKYVQDGYLKPRLVLRSELLNEGILRVDVFETRLTDVQVSGNSGPHQLRVERVAENLLAEPLLRQGSISYALDRLRALPGLTVMASTKVDPKVPNGVILLLAVRYAPVAARLEWTNFGTEEIGPDFISSSVTLNSLTGGREQLNLLFVTATQYSNYHGAGLTFSTPIADHGTTVTLSGFRSASDPTLTAAPIDLAFPHSAASLQVMQRLADTGRQLVRVFLGYDYDDSRIRYQKVDLESDRVSVAQTGIRFDGRISDTQVGAQLSVRRGLDVFGAGVTAINGTSLPANFTVIGAQAATVITWNTVLTSRLTLLGQWTDDILPFDERFKIGTDILARAFKTAEFAGDAGAGAKAEMRGRLPFLATRFGEPALFGYSDYSATWQHNLSAQEHAATVGLGMAWESRFLGASIEWAKPVAVSAGSPMDWAALGDVTVRF
jgi:hemolysin activation/secretion protein